jgi:signal transduction histidine kinase
VRSVAGHEVRAGPPFSRSEDSTDVTVRDGVTTRGFGRTPDVAMFGTPAVVRRSRGRRWRLRDWRLRTKLTAVLVVPLVLAGVLGTLRVTDLAGRAQDFAALARQVGLAQQLGLVVYDLQGERQRVAAMLATGRTVDRAVLQTEIQAQVQRVDTAATKLRAADFSAEALGPIAAQAHPIVGEAHRAVVSRLAGLAALRQATLRSNAAPGNATASSAVTAYSDFISVLLDLERGVLDGAPDPIARQADGVKALLVAKEQASWQHAVLLTGILSGGLSAAQQAALRTSDARFDAAADEFGQAMSPAQRQLYFNTMAVVDRKRLLSAALDRASRGAPLETVPGDWNSAAAGTVETMHQGVATLLNELRTDAQARSSRAWREAFRDGAVVAVLLLLAVALLVVVVRSLLQPLRTLRTAAFEVADRRLPEAVEQVLATDGIPDQTAVDPVPVHSREEVGQVARAFDTVHVQAVRLAAEQAQLRSSLNDVFLHLSGRSQCLLERQLRLIEELRGAAHDPELVSSLLQLDRLAARMRRHSENLLVLAGGTVRRGTEGPVAVLDVLRNAVSEIDEYHRVTVCPPPAATVTGPVAGDLVHLIAELLDNATNVTPQGTMVTLSCVLTEDKSLLVEVTDSGPGLPPDELQAINARLALAPAADASVSGQIGLFVARELAARHGITVRLHQRLGERGVTATALLPPSLVTIDLRVSTGGPKSHGPKSHGPKSNDPKSNDPGSDATASRDSRASIDSAPEEPPTTGWSGTEGQLPLQVSVVDEATAADLFSPSSISPASLGVVTSQGSRPRTAQEEWLDLFGHHEPQPEREPLSDQLGGDQAQVAAATDPLGSPIPPGRAASAGQPEEVREEIFEMVSAWFRERQSAPVSNPPSTITPEWQSPFDEPWQAAQALRTRVDHEFTRAGLPKRQPRAHLVSGADGRVLPTPVPAGPVRTPDAVRGRLSRYQRGLRVGRHARIGPEEQFAWTDIPQRPFEENQQ